MALLNHISGGPALISRRSLLRILSVMLITTSLLLFGQSAYILAKAQLAQVLLARAFNQSLAQGQPVKAWSWADTWPVARIDMPRLSKSAIVLKGGNGEAMAFGPSLLDETSAIGQRGTTVISAHRDTHFAFLQDVRIGDIFRLTRTDGITFSYRVTGTAIVDAEDSGINRYAQGFNLVLATCYPFDAMTRGRLRYLVKADMLR